MTREVPTDVDILELLLHREDEGGSKPNRDLVLDALDALSRDQLEVINALFWEGLSIRQLAARKRTTRYWVVATREQALEVLRVKLA